MDGRTAKPTCGDTTTRFRIGELGRRVGLSPETIRAWERRYGVPSPRRSESGYRLYGAEDERRLRVMRRLREQGVGASKAAKLARDGSPPRERSGQEPDASTSDSPRTGAPLAGRDPFRSGAGSGVVTPMPAPSPEHLAAAARIVDATREFDEAKLQTAVDEALASDDLDGSLEHVFMRALAAIGEGWVNGTISVASEHFGTSLLRGRLQELAQGWHEGSGPHALLACPPGERHDLALLVFGVALHDAGWRISFLGADCPVEALADSANGMGPDAVVLAAVDGRRFRNIDNELGALGQEHPVLIAGAGSSRRLASRLGVVALEGEPTYGARWLAARHESALAHA